MKAIAGAVYLPHLPVGTLVSQMLSVMPYNGNEKEVIENIGRVQLGSFKGISSNKERTLYLAFDGHLSHAQENPENAIIAAYEENGISFLDSIDGDFAFALLDTNQNCLYLARDRIGKKPLYWYHDSHYFLFASEIKALLATGVVAQTVAPDALASFLFFGFTPQDMTPIKEVNKLLPAHYLRFSQKLGKTILPYWSYSACFSKGVAEKKEVTIEKLDSLLQKSVKNRINKSNSIGCIVSGEIGSALTAYYLSKCSQIEPITAFSTCFQNENNDDKSATKEVIDDLKLNGKSSEISAKNFFDELVQIVWHLDEPIGDPHCIANWRLISQAATQSKKVFSGVGSDELFAGHCRYSVSERGFSSLNRLMLIPKSIRQKALIPFFNAFYKPLALAILKINRTNPWRFDYLRDNALFNEAELSEAAPFLADFFDPETFLQKFRNLSKIKSDTSSFLYFDVKTRLPDHFILQYERFTRVKGIDWETPFLDRDLIEYAAQLTQPEDLKEHETASYLKPLLNGFFSKNFIDRPKRTQKDFLASWIYEPSILDTFKYLLKGTLVETGYISKKWLSKQLSQPNSQTFRYLFALLQLEIWLRLFVDRPVQAPKNISLEQLFSEK